MNSVVHTHQLVATAIGAGNVPIKALQNQGLPFAPETPIYPHPDLITTTVQGEEVAATLGDRVAALLRGHGRRCGGRVDGPLGVEHDLPGAVGDHPGHRVHRGDTDAAAGTITSRGSGRTGRGGRRTPTSTSVSSCRASR